MPANKKAIEAARERAKAARPKLHNKPSIQDLLTPQELADAAPFYFVLRGYIVQLKEARESAGLTLADISARTGMAVESLSRLETGAQTNPTWKTLGTYAVALGRRPRLDLCDQNDTYADTAHFQFSPAPDFAVVVKSGIAELPVMDATAAITPVIGNWQTVGESH